MKKAIAWVIALALAALLPGCSMDGAAWQETPVVPQTNESLTVYTVGGLLGGDMMRKALELYQERYPEVRVELIEAEDEETTEAQLERYSEEAVRIMAGEGPDVFIVSDVVMDVEKLVRQGVFADMEPFFEADNFDWEPYNQAVMDGGVWRGKRFIIPLAYDFPLLFTTRSALEETGFDVEACGDYRGFLEECFDFWEDPAQTRRMFCGSGWLLNTLGVSGISVANYEARTINLSSPLLEPALRWRETAMESDPLWNYGLAGGLEIAADVRDGKVLWTGSLLGPLYGLYHDYAALKTLGEEVVMLPIRDIDGGIQAEIEYPVAVRANSENLRNAYEYLKILLSPEVQYGAAAQMGFSLSVLDSASEIYYQSGGMGRGFPAGSSGFYSETVPSLAGDPPTREEFDQLMGYTREITGAYYRDHSQYKLYEAMYDYFFEGADYQETLEKARRKLEIYITE